MNEILTEHLRAHVDELAGKIGEHNVFHIEALYDAEVYITRQWEQQGYAVRRRTYISHGIECANLEITRRGRSDDMILIGAHYDSVSGSPGANDNGSGVAALLELSRLFKDVVPETTLRFVAFVNEESPFFFWANMGSMVYARNAKQNGDPIRFMISLETIGYYRKQHGSQSYPPFLKYFYPDTGNFIAFASNLKSKQIMQECIQAFRASTDFPVESIAALPVIPGIALSDHQSFWRHGYKALMVTDTANYRYPYYHTSQDTPDKLEYASFAEVTNGLFLMLCKLANANC